MMIVPPKSRLPLVTKSAERDAADLGDPNERAELASSIIYGLLGEDALDFLSQEGGGEEDADKKSAAYWRKGRVLRRGWWVKKWDAARHPRNARGQFVKVGSGEAADAAREAVGRVLKGDVSAESAESLAGHLSLLTVKQLRELHKQHGKPIPGKLRAQLVEAVVGRLGIKGADGGGGETPKEAVKGEGKPGLPLADHPEDAKAHQELQSYIDKNGLDKSKVMAGAEALARMDGRNAIMPNHVAEAIAFIEDPPDRLTRNEMSPKRVARMEAVLGNSKPSAPTLAPHAAAADALLAKPSAETLAAAAKAHAAAGRPAEEFYATVQQAYNRAGGDVLPMAVHPANDKEFASLDAYMGKQGIDRGRAMAAASALAKMDSKRAVEPSHVAEAISYIERGEPSNLDRMELPAKRISRMDAALKAGAGSGHALLKRDLAALGADSVGGLLERGPAGGAWAQPTAAAEKPQRQRKPKASGGAGAQPAAAPERERSHVGSAVYSRADAQNLPDEPAVAATTARVIASRMKRNSGDLLKTWEVYDDVKREHPSLTEDQWNRQLLAWSNDGKLTIEASTDPQVEGDNARRGMRVAGRPGREDIDPGAHRFYISPHHKLAPKSAATSFNPADHAPALGEIVQQAGGPHNLASLVDVRRSLAQRGITDRAQQDAVIQHARKAGLVTGSAHEGRGGISPEQRAASLREEGGGEIGSLSVRAPTVPPGPASKVPAAPVVADGSNVQPVELTRDEIRKLLAEPGDRYKDAGLQRSEAKGQHPVSGDTIYGYPYSPEHFAKSDATGRPIRHYVKLPNGQVVHPDELRDAIRRGRVKIKATPQEQERAERLKDWRAAINSPHLHTRQELIDKALAASVSTQERSQITREHQQSVRAAIARGDYVPAAVLADYPGLAAAVPPPASKLPSPEKTTTAIDIPSPTGDTTSVGTQGAAPAKSEGGAMTQELPAGHEWRERERVVERTGPDGPSGTREFETVKERVAVPKQETVAAQKELKATIAAATYRKQRGTEGKIPDSVSGETITIRPGEVGQTRVRFAGDEVWVEMDNQKDPPAHWKVSAADLPPDLVRRLHATAYPGGQS